jgi:hypothetical protein
VTGYDRLPPGTACVECVWSWWCLLRQRRCDRWHEESTSALPWSLGSKAQATHCNLFACLSFPAGIHRPPVVTGYDRWAPRGLDHPLSTLATDRCRSTSLISRRESSLRVQSVVDRPAGTGSARRSVSTTSSSSPANACARRHLVRSARSDLAQIAGRVRGRWARRCKLDGPPNGGGSAAPLPDGNEYRGDDESDDVESAGNREPDDGPSSCGSRAPVTQSTAHATPTATTRPSASLSASESDPVASDNIATAITATRHVNGWVQRNSRGRVAPPLACPSRSTAATLGRRAARPTRLQPGLNRRPPRQRRPAS